MSVQRHVQRQLDVMLMSCVCCGGSCQRNKTAVSAPKATTMIGLLKELIRNTVLQKYSSLTLP